MSPGAPQRGATDWRALAARVKWDLRPFIDGRYCSSAATERFVKIDPATGRALCEVSSGCGADVDQAVEVARRRFDDGCWAGLSCTRRAEVLFRLADLIVEHRAALALLDTLEIGKPIQASQYDAEQFAPLFLRSAAAFADKLTGACAPSTASSIAYNTYEPRGVVGLITPWNFPVVNAVLKLGPALAAGNAVVLKPSELSIGSALKLAELALEAGVPEGIFNVVPGLGPTVGAALALHPDVDLLSFTGSTATGRKVMELSGRSNGKPVLLECGGKCPQVVFEDVVALDRVAEATVQSVLWNQGQVCSAHTRLIVHEAVKGPLLKQVIQLAKRYEPGDPLDEQTRFGPLASPGQRDRVRNYVEEALRSGAEAVLLGRISESGGCYVAPTVFDHVSPHMAIAREEIFGPVLVVQTFQTEEEAVRLSNATAYGLAATIWTRDMGRGKRLARAVRAGSITVRTGGEEDAGSGCVLSHEPQKASGFGSETGLQGLQCYSTLKSVTFSGA
jgi:acyl-CoA reductase-like NAD-dependent aldehyde dehydrogenase